MQMCWRSFSNRASASPPVSRKTTNDRPTSHRKTTNDSSGRSKSVVSRRTTSGSHERNRSKDRKTTALSGSGSRAGRSSTSEEDHESEDSEVDVENVPFHLRKAVPLHLVEARILKKSEKGQPSSPTVTQDMRRRVAQQYVPPDEDKLPDEIYDPAPMEAVMVRKRVIILLIAGFFLWCFAMLPLLAVHVLTFYLSIGVQTHRANADAIFGKLEAMVAQELTPALNLVYMLSVQASMGLFNVSEPYWAITRSLAYTVQESKQMQYVKVVGAAEHMLVFRPGNLHYVPKDEDGDGYIDVLYAPDQITGAVEVVDDICQDADPFFCFDITPDQWSRLTDSLKVDLPSRQLTAWWLGPEFLTKSKQNEVIASPDDWPLIIRFLAHVNVTEGLPSRTDPDIVDPFGIPVPLPARVSLDIALGVDHMGGVLQDVRPDGGEVFILAADGSIIAGAGWQARPAIGESGELYQKIWEMQFEWAKELTPEAVVAEDRIEFMTSASDLVVMKPLGESLAEGEDVADSEYLGAAIEATSKKALRVLVVVPLDAAVAPALTLLVDAAMGVIVAPFATLALVCTVAVCIALLSYCRERCRPVEEEDPYLWKFEDQDDERAW